MRSEISLVHIRDGASNTYLIGENYLNPDNNKTGSDLDDNHVIAMDHNNDTVRWTWYNATTPAGSVSPRQDRAGVAHVTRFGRSHSGGFKIVMCEGLVQAISYSIDPQIHANLGNRRDGQATTLP